jgi:hypothetical protein
MLVLAFLLFDFAGGLPDEREIPNAPAIVE